MIPFSFFQVDDADLALVSTLLLSVLLQHRGNSA